MESYVSQGMMLASISSANDENSLAPPVIPELFLHVWASNSSKSPFQEAASRLLELRMNGENVRFEAFHQLWEIRMRYCRPSRYASISIREVYDSADAMARWLSTAHRVVIKSTSLLDVKIDALSPIRKLDFSNSMIFSDLKENINTLFCPEDRKKAGFDSFLVCSEIASDSSSSGGNEKSPLPIFFLNKFSGEDASRRYSKTHVNKAVKQIESFLSEQCKGADPKRFVLIVTVRGSGKVSKAALDGSPDNILFLDSERVDRLLGPVLARLLNSTETSRDVVH